MKNIFGIDMHRVRKQRGQRVMFGWHNNVIDNLDSLGRIV